MRFFKRVIAEDIVFEFSIMPGAQLETMKQNSVVVDAGSLTASLLPRWLSTNPSMWYNECFGWLLAFCPYTFAIFFALSSSAQVSTVPPLFLINIWMKKSTSTGSIQHFTFLISRSISKIILLLKTEFYYSGKIFYNGLGFLKKRSFAVSKYFWVIVSIDFW